MCVYVYIKSYVHIYIYIYERERERESLRERKRERKRERDRERDRERERERVRGRERQTERGTGRESEREIKRYTRGLSHKMAGRFLLLWRIQKTSVKHRKQRHTGAQKAGRFELIRVFCQFQKAAARVLRCFGALVRLLGV